MRVFLGTMTLTFVVALAACGSPTSGLSDADKGAIRNASQKYVETAKAQDTEGWLQLVGENAIYMPLNHAPIEGRKAIGEWFKSQREAPREEVSLTPSEIDGRGDVAFVRGAYAMSPSGTTGNYIEIWQEQSDGVWRVIRDVWNTNTENTGSTQPPSDLAQAARERDEAVAKADTVTWERLTTVDFTVVNDTGRLLRKAERIAELKKTKPAASSTPCQEEHFNMYGNTAVRRCLASGAWDMETWVKSPQGWQAAAVQLTQAAKTK